MSEAEPTGAPADSDQPPALSAFQKLCGGLGAQVQVALGLIPDPTDEKAKVDLPTAREGIDMLAMLEEKTKGNLAEPEARLLANLLAHLRMLYVQAASLEGEEKERPS